MSKDAGEAGGIESAKEQGEEGAREDLKSGSKRDGEDKGLMEKIRQRKEALRKILEEEAKEREERVKANLPSTLVPPPVCTPSRIRCKLIDFWVTCCSF